MKRRTKRHNVPSVSGSILSELTIHGDTLTVSQATKMVETVGADCIPVLREMIKNDQIEIKRSIPLKKQMPDKSPVHDCIYDVIHEMVANDEISAYRVIRKFYFEHYKPKLPLGGGEPSDDVKLIFYRMRFALWIIGDRFTFSHVKQICGNSINPDDAFLMGMTSIGLKNLFASLVNKQREIKR